MAQHSRMHGGHPPRHGGGGPPHAIRETATLDTSKIVFGSKIDPKLYSDIAEKAAEEVGIVGRQEKKNKPSQLRRFYDELVLLQGKVGSSAERFSEQQPFIQMLKAKVVYAQGRDKVEGKFSSLLRHVVDQARDQDSLKQARLFMEAFMGFYKVYGPKEG
jgi:CRISPR-associated protein Csm2